MGRHEAVVAADDLDGDAEPRQIAERLLPLPRFSRPSARGIATAVLVVATVSGKFILTQLGVSLPAL
jgi:hypothetical protein